MAKRRKPEVSAAAVEADQSGGQTVVSAKGPITVRTGGNGNGGSRPHRWWSKFDILLLSALFAASLACYVWAALYGLREGVMTVLAGFPVSFGTGILVLMRAEGEGRRKGDETTTVSVPPATPAGGIPGHCPCCNGVHA